MFMIEICCGVACFLDFPFLFSFVFLCVFLCHLSVNNAAHNLYYCFVDLVWFQPLEIGDDYCGEHDINHPIKGADPVSSVAAITWSRDDDVTSVAVATTGNHTVAFVGFGSGQIKKVSSSIATLAVNN